MTESETLFNKIINKIPNGVKGRMFGAKCIKSTNGKTAVFLWKENMVFKLDKKNQERAMRIKGAKVGSHLYAPEKQMNGWISIPKNHSDKWIEFTERALEYVTGLK